MSDTTQHRWISDCIQRYADRIANAAKHFKKNDISLQLAAVIQIRQDMAAIDKLLNKMLVDIVEADAGEAAMRKANPDA